VAFWRAVKSIVPFGVYEQKEYAAVGPETVHGMNACVMPAAVGAVVAGNVVAVPGEPPQVV
jgi:hypothetical protein